MRKLILILTLSLSFFNNSHSAEKLFCIDIDTQFSGKTGEIETAQFKIYEMPKYGSGECSKNNVPESFKSIKLVKFDYDKYKKMSNKGNISGVNLKKYLKEKNLEEELKYLYLKEASYIDNKKKSFGGFTATTPKKNSCYQDLDLDLKWSTSGSVVQFDFTNKGENNIQIIEVKILTNDGRQVLLEKVSMVLKPFGIDSVDVFIGDRNKEMLNKASYICSFFYKEETIPKGIKFSDKTFFEKNSLIILAIGLALILLFFRPILSGLDDFMKGLNDSSTQSSTTISSKTTTSSTNLIELVWNGSLPLGQTFWFYYVIANLLVGFATGFLIVKYGSLWFFLIPVVTTIWAGVGTWKSATNYELKRIKSRLPTGWAFGAKAVIIFGFINLAGQLVKFLK
jgi:hypothetical protein